MAVAERRDVADQRDVERRTVFDDRIRVFGDLAGECRSRVRVAGHDSIPGADCKASSATDAFIVVYYRLAVYNTRAAVRAYPHAGSASYTVLPLDNGFAFPMLFHLAGTRAASHTEILQGAAEARLLMAFKVT